MATLAVYLKPRGYNPPNGFRMLWNQWLHVGFLNGYYSYAFYERHQLRVKIAGSK